MRPCKTIVVLDDPSKENRRLREKRRDRTEWRKKYRSENKEVLAEKRKEYNASEHGKEVNARYGKEWREKNKEYDKERKARWWRMKHPNPKPIGRPRKIQNVA